MRWSSPAGEMLYRDEHIETEGESASHSLRPALHESLVVKTCRARPMR